MGIYKKVQMACAEKGIPITALEEQLGFARGSICKWDKNRPSIDRVALVAKVLEKPIEYFVES